MKNYITCIKDVLFSLHNYRILQFTKCLLTACSYIPTNNKSGNATHLTTGCFSSLNMFTAVLESSSKRAIELQLRGLSVALLTVRWGHTFLFLYVLQFSVGNWMFWVYSAAPPGNSLLPPGLCPNPLPIWLLLLAVRTPSCGNCFGLPTVTCRWRWFSERSFLGGSRSPWEGDGFGVPSHLGMLAVLLVF